VSATHPLIPAPAGVGDVGIDGVNPAPGPPPPGSRWYRDNADVVALLWPANDGRTSEDQQDYSDASPT
jgi:hypothetical protein